MGVGVVTREMLEAVAHVKGRVPNGSKARSGDDAKPPREGAGPVDERIPAGRRNTTLASIAGSMRRRGLGEEAIFAALQVTNDERCDPPLDQGEVRRVARSIARYEPGPWVASQRFVTDGPPRPPILSAAPKEEVAAESKLTIRTAKDIAQMVPEEPEWLVRRYVVKGAITDVNGKAKAGGKTTWVLHLVAKVLDGEPFMELPTAKTKVVYLTEQSAPTFREALGRAALLDREDLAVVLWRDTIGLNWPEIVREAAEEAVRRGAELLVIDTLPQFAGLKGDGENSATAALAAMQPIQEAAAVHDLAVVIVRHERKSGGQVGDSGRGSSAFAGAVDIIVSIRRSEGAVRPTIRELHALSRFDETPDVLVVELSEDGYKALGDNAAVAEVEARDALLEAAPTSEAIALSLDELLNVTGLGRTTAQEAIKALLETGELRRIGEGRKGSPYRYWHPKPPEIPPDKPAPAYDQMLSAATYTPEAAESKLDATGEAPETNPDESPATTQSDALRETDNGTLETGDSEGPPGEEWYEQVQKVFEGKNPPEGFDPTCPAVANVLWRRTNLVEKGRYRLWG